MTSLFFIFGILLLIVGAEMVVRGSSRLALALGLSPLVVGLTVVAFGTSAPELAVTMQAAVAGQADLAIGNVVGSNITNVLLILGLAAAITPLVVAQTLIRIDVPIMIGVTLLMYALSYDGIIRRSEGFLLVGGILVYTIFAIYQSRKESKLVKAEYNAEYYIPRRQMLQQLWIHLVMLLGGLVCLTMGARWIVSGAVVFATMIGVSQLVIGLTIVAIGTSLPEIAATAVASLRGERDIAVGNVIGSSIFNILAVLGVASVVAPAGIAVSTAVLRFDLPVMIAVAVACLPIILNGHVIWRWEGWLFLGYYIAYITYQLLNAAHSPSLPLFTTAMLFFVLPLTAVTLVIAVIRFRRIVGKSLIAPVQL